MKGLLSFDVHCEESKIQETIDASKKAFLSGESDRTVSHLEF